MIFDGIEAQELYFSQKSHRIQHQPYDQMYVKEISSRAILQKTPGLSTEWPKLRLLGVELPNSFILCSITIVFGRVLRPRIALARKKTDRSVVLSMAFIKGSGIIWYSVAVFSLEVTENVSMSFKSENNFENEEKKRKFSRVFLLALQLQGLSAAVTQSGVCSCFRLKYMFSL